MRPLLGEDGETSAVHSHGIRGATPWEEGCMHCEELEGAGRSQTQPGTSQRVVLRLPMSDSLESCQKCRFPGLALDLIIRIWW